VLAASAVVCGVGDVEGVGAFWELGKVVLCRKCDCRLEQLLVGEGCQLVVDGLGEDFKVGHFQGLSGL
jgi:hypothetical protein